jgi:hypothetical protein
MAMSDHKGRHTKARPPPDAAELKRDHAGSIPPTTRRMAVMRPIVPVDFASAREQDPCLGVPGESGLDLPRRRERRAVVDDDGEMVVILRRRLMAILAVAAVLTAGVIPTASAGRPRDPVVRELVTFAANGCVGGCGSGSTIGPDGALYVTDGKAGRVLRVDPRSGAVKAFAQGLPPSIEGDGIGGAMDVAFIGHTAYVLVTLVGPAVGQPNVVDGIYRVRRDGSASPIADIGLWSTQNPPTTPFFVASGVQYAMQPFRGGFLVTDGHHNRVLQVGLNGDISQVIAFGNIVPTGLETSGRRVYLGQAGPIPHLPQTGRVVAFTPGARQATPVAAGASLIVDVEFGPRHELYALSQGVWDLPNIPDNEGMPASHNTGRLVRVDRHGFTSVAEGLDQPTSVEFIGNTAFVVTLTGKVLRIDNIGQHH